jgi:uncharacterized membrane protein HdeD (DUF308 family)
MATEREDLATDGLSLDPLNLRPAAVTAVRTTFAVSGIAAIVLGVLLLVVPGRTLQFAAIVLGIYFLVAGVMRIALSLFGQLPYAQHRVLGILFGALLLICGILILRDSSAAATTLLIILVLFTGIGWIIDGIMSLVESKDASSRGWAVFFGVVSIVAGIAVLAIPGWSAVWLLFFAAIALIVMGIAAVIRAITFGRRHAAASGSTATAVPTG